MGNYVTLQPTVGDVPVALGLLFQTVSILSFGGVGDGVTDNSAALAAAIASFPTNLDGNTYSYAGTILFPPGQYYFASTIQINRQVRLVGAGSPAGNALGPSQLLFADNIDGIAINHANVPTNGALDAAGAMLDGLYLKRSKNTAGTLGNGVNVSTRCEIRNCMIDSFRGDGIHIVADSSGSPSTNANNWHIENCRVISNGGNGLYVQGGDTNSGTAVGLDCSSNTLDGIYDSSFLGNSYIGCHTASNVRYGYHSDNANARNVFVGCYTEGGEVHSIAFPAFVFGGILSSVGVSLGTCSIIGDSKFTPLQAYNSNANVRAYFGGDASGTANVVLALGDNSESSNAWPQRLRRVTGGYALDWANNGNYYLRLTNSQATIANGYPRDMTATTLPQSGGVWLQAGFFIGGGASGGKFIQSAAAAPVAGTYVVGDIVLNNAPTSGGFIGWVCTTAGSPGTWKTFGAIS